jgi:transcriptional regulator with XRE-family HTH domain
MSDDDLESLLETAVNGNTTYPALVGNIIARLRKERGIGQAEFAAMVGLGQSTWSRIEKGQSALTIEQLAKAAGKLSLQPHELLALVDGAVDNLNEQGIGTLLDRIGANNMALLGSIPVVGPTLTAVLSGISSYQEHSAQQRKAAEAKVAAEPKTDMEAANMEAQGSESKGSEPQGAQSSSSKTSETDQILVSEQVQLPSTEIDEDNKKAAE